MTAAPIVQAEGCSEPAERAQVLIRIGANVRAARHEKQMGLAVMAALAGISTATLSRIETGKQGIETSALVRFAKIVGVAPAVLLGITPFHSSSEAVIAALERMPDEERQRVVRTANSRRQASASAERLVAEALEGLDAVRETLDAIKRRLKTRMRQR